MRVLPSCGGDVIRRATVCTVVIGGWRSWCPGPALTAVCSVFAVDRDVITQITEHQHENNHQKKQENRKFL